MTKSFSYEPEISGEAKVQNFMKDKIPQTVALQVDFSLFQNFTTSWIHLMELVWSIALVQFHAQNRFQPDNLWPPE